MRHAATFAPLSGLLVLVQCSRSLTVVLFTPSELACRFDDLFVTTQSDSNFEAKFRTEIELPSTISYVQMERSREAAILV
jgi:hypothetical protein